MGPQTFDWCPKARPIRHLLWQFTLFWRRFCWLSGQICDYGWKMRMKWTLYAWEKSNSWGNGNTYLTPSKQVKVVQSAGKVMALVFWDADGILMVDFLQKGHTVTGQYYETLVWQLRDNIMARQRGKLIKGVRFHQDTATAHKSSVALTIIHDCGFELIDQPSHSSALAPSDFRLFPNLKEPLAGNILPPTMPLWLLQEHT